MHSSTSASSWGAWLYCRLYMLIPHACTACCPGPQRKYEELGLQPYVAHATFQYSGTPGKRNRFREAMLFEDPPEYYNHEKVI